MINFDRLNKDVLKIKEFIDASPISFCDISLGVRYMWRDVYPLDYAVVDDTLILKESCKDYKNAFYFPINKNGKDVDFAFDLIEKYAKENNIPLKFYCIDNAHKDYFIKRYPFSKIYSFRDSSDYIYDAEKFKTYSGKKFGGQRNHVNKFKKLYPDYRFNIITQNDLPEIKEFLKKFEGENAFTSWSAKEEEHGVYDLISNSFSLNLLGGMIKVDGKIVAISLSEKVGDTLIIHIEKALTEYDGVYPTIASETVKAFASEEIKYVNREDDSGDTGLRTSKLQYHPIEIKDKYFVDVETCFNKIVQPKIITERLIIDDIEDSDKDEYFSLYTDEDLNEFWGYDYKTDCQNPTPEYFISFAEDLKEKKEEYSLAVRKEGKMIGELVLWNFGYDGSLEIGFRFIKDEQNKGYAYESVSALINYIRENIEPTKIKVKCYKQNLPSIKLIEKLKFNKTNTDDTYFYYEL